MNRDQKAALVEELSEEIRSADAIFAVDYRGISVAQAAELRNRLRDAQTRFRVVKNSLTERASDRAGTESLKAMLEGPTALAFVSGDVALAAKALSDSARTFGTLGFKGGLMNGDTLTAEQIQSIARLPARDVLHGQLVGTIAAPLSQLVRTLNALIAGVAIQLQQVAEQELVSGTAPPSDVQRAPGADGEAAASDTSASGADATPPVEAGEEAGGSEASASEADATPPVEAGEEAAAEEVPAETAEEAVPEAAAPEAAEAASAEVSAEEATPEASSEATAPNTQDDPLEAAPPEAAAESETSEETETEASDGEASEE